MRARLDRMPRIACAVTDLPEPEFADDREGSPRHEVEAHGPDRVNQPGIAFEVDAEISHAQ